MTTTAKRQAIPSVCPRCSNQVPGIVISEDDNYFVSCLSCGYILIDRGRRPSPFGDLFMQFAKMTPEPKQEPKPFVQVVKDTDSKPLPIDYIARLRRRCCTLHQDKSISECRDCEKTIGNITDIEAAVNEIFKRLRKRG
jgi:Zn ribbon nucleic-acid-binding protein